MDRPARAASRRWPCSATSSPGPSGRSSPRSPCSARSGRRWRGRPSTASRCGPSTSRSPSRWRPPASPTAWHGARRPAGGARGGRRRARRRALVGGPRRAPRRRRAGVRRRRRGDGRRPRRHRCRTTARRDVRRTCGRRSAGRWPTGARVAVVAGRGTSRRSTSTPFSASGRRRPAPRRAAGEGRGHVGAVDAPPARAEHRVRRRCRQPRLVRPRVRPSRSRGRVAVLRRRRPRAAGPRPAGVARPPHRRVAAGHLARRAAAAAPAGSGRGARRRRRRARRAAARRRRAGRRRGDRRGAAGGAAGAAAPATWPRPSGRPGCGRRRRRAPSSSTCARPTGVAARCCCTGSSRSACRGAWSRRAAARRARSARRGAWRGSPSCRCASSSGRGSAPPSPRRRRRRSSSGPSAPPGWPTPPAPSSWRCSPTCPTRSAPAVRRLGELAATAPDVAELMDALGPLAARAALRRRPRHRRRRAWPSCSTSWSCGWSPACERAAEGLDDDAARAMIERMSAVQAALALVDHPARTAELPTVLERVAAGRRVHGLVQGRATRLLHDGGSWPAARVEARLGRALTPGTPAADGRRVRRGLPRRQRHRAAPRRPAAGRHRRVGQLAGARAVHVGRGAAAAHVRRLRTGRAPPARHPPRHRPRRPRAPRSATTSTPPAPSPASPPSASCSASRLRHGRSRQLLAQSDTKWPLAPRVGERRPPEGDR